MLFDLHRDVSRSEPGSSLWRTPCPLLQYSVTLSASNGLILSWSVSPNSTLVTLNVTSTSSNWYAGGAELKHDNIPSLSGVKADSQSWSLACWTENVLLTV